MELKMKWSLLLNTDRIVPKFSTTNNEKKTARAEFADDANRITSSLPFRKLGEKAQIFCRTKYRTESTHTFRSRLTHSMECATVGRELGTLVCEKIPEILEDTEGFTAEDVGTLVSNACLVHDIGNPAFGHVGEEAAVRWWRKWDAKQTTSIGDCSDFFHLNGNPTGFRTLISHPEFWEDGAGLSTSLLAVYTKYPRTVCGFDRLADAAESPQKIGAYSTEWPWLCVVAGSCGLIAQSAAAFCRHPLAYLTEAADDICYNLSDAEDGVAMGLLSYEDVKAGMHRAAKYTGVDFGDRPLTMTETRAKTVSALKNYAANHWATHYDEIMRGEFHGSLLGNCRRCGSSPLELVVFTHEIYYCPVVLERKIGCFAIVQTVLDGLVDALTGKWSKESGSPIDPYGKYVLLWLPADVRRQLKTCANTKGFALSTETVDGCKLQNILMCVFDYVFSLTDEQLMRVYNIFVNGHPTPV